MQKKAPSIEGVLVGLCITPDNAYFDYALEFFKTYYLLRETKYKKKKMFTKYAYEETAKHFNMKDKTLKTYVRRALYHGYKRSKFKFLFNYFDIDVEVGYRPSPTEVANLIILIERDREKQLKQEQSV